MSASARSTGASLAATRMLVLVGTDARDAGIAPQSALERVRASGRLRIGIDATYPPFGIAEGGEFSGFDVDIARAIARELGVEAELVNASFDGVFPALQNGSFDVVISAVTITPERSATMLFSDPYIDAGQQIAVRERQPDRQARRSRRPHGRRADQHHRAVRDGEAPGRDAREIQHDRSRAARSAERAHRRRGERRPGAALHDPHELPGAQDGRQRIHRRAVRHRARARQRRPAARGQRRAVAHPGQRRIREAVHEVVRRGRRLQGAATASPRAFDPGLVARTWSFFLRGVWLTAAMAVSSLVLGLPLGLALALARVQPQPAVSTPAAVYVEVMRGTPLLVQILFVYFVLPIVGINLPAYTSGILALTLNAAAYISEVIRAGILSIDAGQMEAARALGMSYWQAMRRIILPQTFRRVVPPLTNEGHRAAEGLVARVGDRPDRARAHRQELASRYAAPLTIWPLVALLYLALTFPLTRVAEYLERRWRPVTRA